MDNDLAFGIVRFFGPHHDVVVCDENMNGLLTHSMADLGDGRL